MRPGETLWEKLGAATGMFAVLLLLIQFLIAQSAALDLTAPAATYVAALLAARMQWEWVTFLRIVGGLSFVWFMGSLSSRLRLAEGEPGRLANIAFGVGTIWGFLWILSAMFNSASILMATDYANPEGARTAGILAQEILFILTPAVIFTLFLATSFVGLRFGGFSRSFALATSALTAVLLMLAIVDWWGAGTLSTFILFIAFGWIALTSALLIPIYDPPDYVRGSR